MPSTSDKTSYKAKVKQEISGRSSNTQHDNSSTNEAQQETLTTNKLNASHKDKNSQKICGKPAKSPDEKLCTANAQQCPETTLDSTSIRNNENSTSESVQYAYKDFVKYQLYRIPIPNAKKAYKTRVKEESGGSQSPDNKIQSLQSPDHKLQNSDDTETYSNYNKTILIGLLPPERQFETMINTHKTETKPSNSKQNCKKYDKSKGVDLWDTS